MDYISATERIYREICQPSPTQPAPKPAPLPTPISLDYADVRRILRNDRAASLEELQWILEHVKQFGLSDRQRNDLSVRATIALASRGQPEASPQAELFALLDIVETPVGLLHHRSWFENELRAGAQRIASCKLHRPPRCDCWRTFRERLWSVQDHYGPTSPEGWTAARLWEHFEELEQASRPEQTVRLNPVPEQIPE